uniref:Uncharacterized protein n=1 Tax=Branchiostoma floridae TaxID=7739 RepID=C3XYA9_BRAFL|eukprot:XP_002610784.1 hypothetical protein BRAFLDRAFT_91576 [Branchiostoma floridae]
MAQLSLHRLFHLLKVNFFLPIMCLMGIWDAFPGKEKRLGSLNVGCPAGPFCGGNGGWDGTEHVLGHSHHSTVGRCGVVEKSEKGDVISGSGGSSVLPPGSHQEQGHGRSLSGFHLRPSPHMYTAPHPELNYSSLPSFHFCLWLGIIYMHTLCVTIKCQLHFLVCPCIAQLRLPGLPVQPKIEGALEQKSVGLEPSDELEDIYDHEQALEIEDESVEEDHGHPAEAADHAVEPSDSAYEAPVYIADDIHIPPEFELRESKAAGVGLGVWTKVAVQAGEKMGPFTGIQKAEVKDMTYAWERKDDGEEVQVWMRKQMGDLQFTALWPIFELNGACNTITRVDFPRSSCIKFCEASHRSLSNFGRVVKGTVQVSGQRVIGTGMQSGQPLQFPLCFIICEDQENDYPYFTEPVSMLGGDGEGQMTTTTAVTQQEVQTDGLELATQ